MTPDEFNEAVARATATAEAREASLAREWRRVLDGWTREMLRVVETLSLTAAGDLPGWRMPNRNELQAAIDKKLDEGGPRKVKVRAGEAIVGDLTAGLNVNFDQRNPLIDNVIRGQQGGLIQGVSNTWVGHAMTSLQDSYDQGRSIPNAAKDMRSHLGDLSRGRAKTIARTELIGVKNGATLEVARLAGVAKNKKWVATMDSRTRDTHVYLNGEIVPIDQPFSNGLDHPGEYGGPAREVINCRCTLDFTDESPADASPSLTEPGSPEEERARGILDDLMAAMGRGEKLLDDARQTVREGQWVRVAEQNHDVFHTVRVKGEMTRVQDVRVFLDDDYVKRLSKRGPEFAKQHVVEQLNRYLEKMTPRERAAIDEVALMGKSAPEVMYGAIAPRISATGGNRTITWWAMDMGESIEIDRRIRDFQTALHDGVWWHEVAHLIGKNGGPLSDFEWKAAQRTDEQTSKVWADRRASHSAMPINQGSRGSHLMPGTENVSAYGATNIKEDWAESYRLWRTSKAHGTSDTIMLRDQPRMEDGVLQPTQVRGTFADIWPERAKILEREFGAGADRTPISSPERAPERTPVLRGNAGRDADLRDRYQRGESIDELSRTSGLSVARLRQILRGVKQPKPEPPPRPPKAPGGNAARDAELVRRREAGESLEDLSKSSGLSVARLRQVLRGVKVKETTGDLEAPPRPPVRSANYYRDLAIQQARADGESLESISARTGLSVARLRQIVAKKLG